MRPGMILLKLISLGWEFWRFQLPKYTIIYYKESRSRLAHAWVTEVRPEQSVARRE